MVKYRYTIVWTKTKNKQNEKLLPCIKLLYSVVWSEKVSVCKLYKVYVKIQKKATQNPSLNLYVIETEWHGLVTPGTQLYHEYNLMNRYN